MTTAERLLRGKSDLDTVYEAGKQAEYNTFWDNYQNKGNRLDYSKNFCGQGWNNETLKPKYNLTLHGANATFNYCNYDGSLKELLSKQGITLTFPDSYNISQLFDSSKFTEIGILDFSTVKHTSSGYIFRGCANLHTIEKIILSQVVSLIFTDWFNGCTELHTIAFEGVIENDINFQWCTKLTHDSLMSIINALSDTVSGKTLTIGETNRAKLATDEIEIAENKGWTVV